MLDSRGQIMALSKRCASAARSRKWTITGSRITGRRGHLQLRQAAGKVIHCRSWRRNFQPAGSKYYPIWLTGKATDYLRGDIPNKGSLTTMLETAHLAEAFGLRYEVQDPVID